MTCTRKKQCSYGDICPTARSDEYNLIDASCYKPLEHTNEEWFCRLSTEEKADLLSELVWWIHPSVQGGRKVELTKESFLRWLKEKHNE